MHQWAYDLGLGLRWHRKDWWIDVGYSFGQSGLGGSDSELFGNDMSVDIEQQYLFIGGSVRL